MQAMSVYFAAYIAGGNSSSMADYMLSDVARG